MMQKISTIGVFALSFVLTFPLQAQDVKSPAQACKADVEKFCATEKKPGGKIGPCLKQHDAELTPECKLSRDAAHDANKAIRAACKDDHAKFCATVERGHNGIVKCLESHASELQADCNKALSQRPGAKH